MIFEQSYERFLDVCRSITSRRERVAKAMLYDHLEGDVGPSLSSEDLLSHILAESLLNRIDRRLVEAKNIYLQKFDVSQIDMFYAMTQGYPQVPAAHRVANQYLAHELAQHERGTLVEIGVGKGVQVAGLLGRLAERKGSLERLELIAVDPDPQNLADSKKRIDGLRRSLPFKLRFHAFEGLLETFSPTTFASMRDRAGANVVMNSAYTLHHVMHEVGDRDLRTRLLRTLNEELRPRLFTLVEPNADHDTEMLAHRLRACWEHFGNVFDLIDHADLPSEQKYVIKEKFFGRELRDIFGTSDAFRCERHEPLESWMLRLTKAGFEPYEPVLEPDVRLPEHCTLDASEGLTRLGYRDVPLLAVFAYRGGARPGHA